MKKSRNIFLIGFMGCGKSTLGKKLANKLNIPFFDLDDEIERSEGVSIHELFENQGEDYFRKKEKEILSDFILKKDNFIMSLGGGTPCFYDNMKLINQSGISIYLKYNSGILTSRLINAKASRPLINKLSELELEEFVINKLKEREVFYNQADILLEKNNLKLEDLLKVI